MSQDTVLIIAAHPDDEILGCGGSIVRHRKEGDQVSILILADGVGGRQDIGSPPKPAEVEERHQCARRANNILGVEDLILLSYPDNRMDEVPLLKIVQDIERVLDRCKPAIIYTHHSCDVNIDHRLVHDAVITACRPQPGQCVRKLLFFETPSSTEWRPATSMPPFEPQWFVDISDTLSLKLEAMAAYGPELRDFPHPRSLAAIEHLARWRGASIGLSAAEAFVLGRLIL